LQRQILYNTDEISLAKVLLAEQKLKALNPEIKIRAFQEKLTPDNAQSLIKDYDLVIDGSDNFSTRYCVNDACVLENKPLIFGAMSRFDAQISVFHWQEGPCYRCLYPHAPPPEAVPNCSEAGVLGVLPGTAGSLMATEALKILLSLGQPLSGQLLTYDALNSQFFKRSFEKNRNCAVCGEHPTITALQPSSSAFTERQGLDWNELEKILSTASCALIDVRNVDEFQKGSLPKAQNIPLVELSLLLEKGLPELLQNSMLVFFCQSGKRSARAVELLAALGFKNTHHVRGGLDGRASSHDLLS